MTPPSLEELTQAVFALRQELTGKITEALVAQRHAQRLNQRIMPCPHCQRLLPARPAPPRTVHTMVGEVSLSRPYFYCLHCQQGFSPLDDALQLSERRTPMGLAAGRSETGRGGPLCDGPGAVHAADRPVVERPYHPCGGRGAEPRAGGAGGESHGC